MKNLLALPKTCLLNFVHKITSKHFNICKKSPTHTSNAAESTTVTAAVSVSSSSAESTEASSYESD